MSEDEFAAYPRCKDCLSSICLRCASICLFELSGGKHSCAKSGFYCSKCWPGCQLKKHNYCNPDLCEESCGYTDVDFLYPSGALILVKADEPEVEVEEISLSKAFQLAISANTDPSTKQMLREQLVKPYPAKVYVPSDTDEVYHGKRNRGGNYSTYMTDTKNFSPPAKKPCLKRSVSEDSFYSASQESIPLAQPDPP